MRPPCELAFRVEAGTEESGMKRRTPMRVVGILGALLVLALALGACGNGANNGAGSASSSSKDASGANTQAKLTEEEQATHMQAITGDGIVNTFIGEKFCDDKVTNDEEAKACIMKAIDRIGGDKSTVLMLHSVYPKNDGMTVYIFTQRVGEFAAYGSTVKLVVDKDSNPIALVGSIIPNANVRPVEEWAVDAAGAEKVVMDTLKSEGATDTLVTGATVQAVVGVSNVEDRYVCAWIVYTFQPHGETEQAYTAHYVSAEGEYLNSIPVSGPDDPNAAEGQSAKSLFDFDAYEPAEADVTIPHVDGSSETVSVPVLKDAKTGKTYLADATRKILCADYTAYKQQQEIKPTEAQGADPIDAHEYYTFIRVWDFYASIGWVTPDDSGTPALLLMNNVDPNGNPVDNAFYETKENGFQVFDFGRGSDFGEYLDIMAHEFTHCVTGATMTANLYKNDPGAINEGMSDVLGNLIEMKLDGDKGAWIVAEGRGEKGAYRSMSDPHEYGQPAFAFDAYYAPRPPVPSEMNDQGGVHRNSSLLNIVSYRLSQAGMSVEDQGNFWINVALVLSPQTDYPMLAKMLPWVMEHSGLSQYVEPLKAAIDEAKYTTAEDPGTIPEGCGAVALDCAEVKEAAEAGRVRVAVFRAPDADIVKRAETWPMAGATVAKANLPAGDYYVTFSVGDERGVLKRYMIYGEGGWKALESPTSEAIKAAGKPVKVEAGKTLEVAKDGFGELATGQLKEIDTALEEMASA